jgi:hypothetical protein
MHASVTKNITNQQKVLMAISNLKGAASEWFFTTNDRYAKLYGGQPLFNSFAQFLQLFQQRFGQMNTANAMAQIETVKLRKNETVATFAQKLENLFFSAKLVDEQAKLFYFFRAINDPLKSQVRGCKPVTLAQAVQDAVHFDQRMSKEEQERSRFAETERASNRPNNKPSSATVKKLEDGDDSQKGERPAVGKEKNKFSKKYNTMNQPNQKNQGDRKFKKGITCYTCGQEGHYSSNCKELKSEQAVTRIAQEEDNPFIDTPDNEPDFDEPALAMILDAHWEAFEDEELAEANTPQQRSPQACVNVLTGEQLDPRLLRKRTPFPILDGFVAPVQPNGPNPDPIMALPLGRRQRDQRARSENNNRQQRIADARNAGVQPLATNPPLQLAQTNHDFPTKWVPTKELIKHCPPNVLGDLKRAASDAVHEHLNRANAGTICQADAPGTLPEQLTITPQRTRPPLNRTAARVGGINGVAAYVHLDSGANVGMMDLKTAEKAGLSSSIRNGNPSFSTADGKMATGLGWLDAKLGLGTRLEVKTRFVVAQGLDYQVLLGTNALRPLHVIINYHSKRFTFQLPTSKEWRSLPLIDSAPHAQNAQAVALMLDESIPEYVERIIQELLATPEPMRQGSPHEQQSEAADSPLIEEEMFELVKDDSEDEIQWVREVRQANNELYNEKSSQSVLELLPADSDDDDSEYDDESKWDLDEFRNKEIEEYFSDAFIRHMFNYGVLLQSATEAKNFLKLLLKERRILPEEAALNAAQYAGFFKNPRNKDVLHPINEDLKRSLPKTYRIQRLEAKEIAQVGRALEAHTGTTPEKEHGSTFRAQDCNPLTEQELKAHWEAVKPQLLLGEDLTDEQRNELLQVLEKHCLVFSKDKGNLGLVKEYFHTIDTGDSKSIKLPPHWLSHAEKEEIARQMQPMLEWDVIRRSKSPYAAPVVLAKKKDDTWRFCVDLWALNKATVLNRYPIPRIDAIFDQLGQAQYFSTMDANTGYWQIPMAPQDVHKTAFITHQGLFEFTWMPFGLTGAPETYQNMMDEVLHEDIHGEELVVTQYLDDTCAYTVLWSDHLAVLDCILTKLAKINLKLAPNKCVFGTKSAEHLGHIIRKNQLLADPKKVAAVFNWPQPRNVTDFRAFLGLAGYYKHFVKDFSIKSRALHYLTKKEVPFKRGPDQETAFQTVKAALCSAPILLRLDFEKPFILDTDFSYSGVGATLSQIGEDGREHPIAFASRSLQSAEANYWLQTASYLQSSGPSPCDSGRTFMAITYNSLFEQTITLWSGCTYKRILYDDLLVGKSN